jgi:hypothetical protein
MPVTAGAPSTLVSEVTRTAGTGGYFIEGGVPRAVLFQEAYSVGETFDYFCDDGGGIAEYGKGILSDNTIIDRVSIHWTSIGGEGAAPISWPTSGRRFIRAVVSGATGTTTTNNISGFWGGTVPSGQRIERFLFTKPGTLPANLPTSRATVDTPPSSTGTAFLVGAGGNRLLRADLSSRLAISLGTAGPAVFSLQKAGVQVGTMTFAPGAHPTTGYLVGASGNKLLRAGGGFLVRSFGAAATGNATFSFPSSVAFVPGDKFEIVGPNPGDADLADIVWTFDLS